jgi:pSer/pThr/pTyr-binding forkhead associated (FHA) protein
VKRAQGFIVADQAKNCKFCGKPLEESGFCGECTLTDLELPSVLTYRAGQEREAPAYLIEARSKQRYPIIGAKWKIGRDPTNQVIIDDDPYTSRFHAWITCEDGHYFVEDLGSTNGTLLNGQPLVRRRPLVNGDRVRIGRSDFSFVLDQGAAVTGSRDTASKQKED